MFNGAHREVLWRLTGDWRTRTLPADNLDDPAVVVDGRLLATRAGYELRKQLECEQG
jgi:hypothetical protein